MSEQVPDSTHIHRLLGTPTMFLRTGVSSPFCALPSPVLPRLAPSGVALLKVSFQAPAPPFLHHQDYLGVPAPPGLMPPSAHSCCLACSAFRGRKPNGTAQCFPISPILG